MIKTIIFDNGGVLVSRNQDGAYALFAKLYGISEKKLTAEYDNLAKSLDAGKICGDEFYASLNRHFGKDLPVHEVREAHRLVFKRKDDVWEHARILGRSYELALLSNFGDFFDEFNKDWKLEELIDRDKMFVSCKLGMIKPGKEIYKYALKELGRRPEETIFVDDVIENIETARALGMNAVQFKTVQQLKTELAEIIERENEK